MADLIGFLPQATSYLHHLPASILTERLGWCNDGFCIRPLAQGEYNMNYLVEQQNGWRWVLRVNIGSQIHRRDQILYEFKTLQHLEGSGHTPAPYFVDDSKEHLQFGVLGMEYLPGQHLEYHNHAMDAARLFATIHEFTMKTQPDHLFKEEQPLTLTYEECDELLPVYIESDLANPDIRNYLLEVLDWADTARLKESFFTADPIPCIINTEVNSSNFIVHPDTRHIHLVDWEKQLWGDPSQDLSHFCVPTTTLWKTTYRMEKKHKQHFLQTYCDNLHHCHLRDTIQERVRLRDPFNCLRGISWSAMAWIKYQTGEAAIRNEDTWQKLCSYMDYGFIRSLFDPYMKGNGYLC